MKLFILAFLIFVIIIGLFIFGTRNKRKPTCGSCGIEKCCSEEKNKND
tara:strand:- start:37806 stop:37949 length:144 start_codon:yes stop_codon:yes gene_type:complete